jgi:hypothetical protein
MVGDYHFASWLRVKELTASLATHSREHEPPYICNLLGEGKKFVRQIWYCRREKCLKYRYVRRFFIFSFHYFCLLGFFEDLWNLPLFFVQSNDAQKRVPLKMEHNIRQSFSIFL